MTEKDTQVESGGRRGGVAVEVRIKKNEDNLGG